MTETSDYTGILIPADIHEEPSIHQGLTFDQMKELMGIDLAQVHYVGKGNTYTMWADEEGMLTGTPVQNYRAASLILEESNLHRPVVGPVFISGPANEDGVTLPLDVTLMGQLMQKLNVGNTAALEQVRQINNISAGIRQP